MTEAQLVELAIHRVADRLRFSHSELDKLVGEALKSVAQELNTLTKTKEYLNAR
jgi:hypothetical protein